MRKTRFLVWLIPVLFVINIKDWRKLASSVRPGKDHAILFAVKDYDHWSDLKNPIRDAEALAKQLRENYGFDDVKLVSNPTIETIQATLNQYLTKNYGPDDQLFIYFSGHGEFNDLTKEGFFIPQAALKNDPYQNSYLPLTRLERIVSNIPCPHILLTIDACYSGTFNEHFALDKSDASSPTWRRPGIGADDSHAQIVWIKAKLEKQSRLCITSGGKERTSDGIEHSPMTEAFLKCLNQPGDDYILTVDELIGGLKNLQPVPKSFTFGTHQSDGNFLFIRSGSTPIDFDVQSFEGRQRDLQAWKDATIFNNPASYILYLQKFPNGAFREEATKALKVAEEDQEWEFAKTKNTTEAYSSYLKRYPSGRFVEEARKLTANNTDMDNDGIPNLSDKCPDEPGDLKNEGCPEPSPAFDNMVFVKGGTFLMGSDNKNESEKPAHSVTVGDFYMSRTEVTQEQWRAVMGFDPSNLNFKGCNTCPVDGVSWDDVQKYLRRLNTRTGKNYRLPTEAEWEYAARGGLNTQFFTYAGSNNAEEVAWYATNSGKRPQPVGQKKANSIGLYDMSGNLWEWCEDWYDSNYYSKSPTNNPKGPEKATHRVVRGASWIDNEPFLSVFYRNGGLPERRTAYIGFRIVRQP